MSCQSPLISIPKKSTHEVDWNGPIRTIIAQLYGEDPKNYAEECSILQRCRQDAVKGASSDQTGRHRHTERPLNPGRDLLYKYFGQLELLELRFAEIKVPFIWWVYLELSHDLSSLMTGPMPLPSKRQHRPPWLSRRRQSFICWPQCCRRLLRAPPEPTQKG